MSDDRDLGQDNGGRGREQIQASYLRQNSERLPWVQPMFYLNM